MSADIVISEGVIYTPQASARGAPAGCLTTTAGDWYVSPFPAPIMIQGTEFPGCACGITPLSGRRMNLSKRVWLLMLAADRKAAGVDEDVAATYAVGQAARERTAAANAALAAHKPTLSEQQIKERDYDAVHNEGAYGYNPYRKGDRPTYWTPEQRRERHYPEGA